MPVTVPLAQTQQRTSGDARPVLQLAAPSPQASVALLQKHRTSCSILRCLHWAQRSYRLPAVRKSAATLAGSTRLAHASSHMPARVCNSPSGASVSLLRATWPARSTFRRVLGACATLASGVDRADSARLKRLSGPPQPTSVRVSAAAGICARVRPM